jgi:hypothetical protein
MRMRALITKLIAWLERLAGEGKTDMNDILTSAEGAAASATTGADALLTNLKVDAATDIATAKADVEKLLTATSSNASALVGDLDVILGEVKGLLDFSGRTPKAWSEVVAFAKTLVSTSDVDALLAKIQQLLQRKGQSPTGWDELIALAKTPAA